MPIRTNEQNRIIHTLRNQRGLADEYYRTLVFNISNGRTETSKELSVAEADTLIKELGGTPPARSRRTRQRRNKAAGVTLLVTAAQRTTLTELATARWGEAYTEPLCKLCQRMYRRSQPHTSKQAIGLIEAIKSMNEREAAKEAA